MHLEGKVAIVTGASRGIGRAVAINLAQSGADVVVNYSGSEGAAQETVEAVQALGRKAIKIKANVANADEVASMVEEAHKEFGHIDNMTRTLFHHDFRYCFSYQVYTFKVDIYNSIKIFVFHTHQ